MQVVLWNSTNSIDPCAAIDRRAPSGSPDVASETLASGFIRGATLNTSPAPTPIDPILWIGDDHNPPTSDERENAFAVATIQPVRNTVAVALVPKSLAGQVACNGIPLAVGLHSLAHADRLDLGARSYWIAIQTSVEKTEYNPAQHGHDVFCFITKARLSEGQPIVVCPGTAGQTCGTIYLEQAWQRAMESAQFQCPNCSFTPQASPWRPPEQHRDDSLADLLALVAG